MNREQLQIRFDILTARYNEVTPDVRENYPFMSQDNQQIVSTILKHQLMTEMKIVKAQIKAIDAEVVNSKSPDTGKEESKIVDRLAGLKVAFVLLLALYLTWLTTTVGTGIREALMP